MQSIDFTTLTFSKPTTPFVKLFTQGITSHVIDIDCCLASKSELSIENPTNVGLFR